MNERIKELAEQAGFDDSESQNHWAFYNFDLERFAELVRQEEREACAKLCETVAWVESPIYCAMAIRARGEQV